MKYDLKQNLDNPATALGKILARVPRESDVLELGAATGYMTRYMHERLQCRVSIVEIDEEGFAQAMRYAQDGFRGDLQQDGWYAHYREKAFDCVVISNVLEHVRNPFEILLWSRQLVREGGKLLVAVPNTSHNDVLINLLSEDWRYTDLGLLDRDHVFFYCLRNIEEIIRKADFTVTDEEFVYLATGKTEQKPDLMAIPEDVLAYLRGRRMGEVYQFVLEAKPGSAAEEQPLNRVEDKTSALISLEDYTAKLEGDLVKARGYIDVLEQAKQKEREEAVAYQAKLECGLAEAHDYMGVLEQAREKEREEAVVYQANLERSLAEARDYIGVLEQAREKEREEAAAYQAKLEGEIRELRAYTQKLERQLAEGANPEAGVEQN